jgi:PAS domain S-box-containing protein
MTEKTSQERAVRVEEIADALDDIVWILDPDARKIVYCSPAFERICGRPVDELIASTAGWLSVMHPDDRMAFTADELRLGVAREYRIIRPDGEIRWIRSRAHPRRIEAYGSRPMLVGLSEDVTDAKRERLRQDEQQAFLHAALDAAGLIPWRIELGTGRLEVTPYADPLAGKAGPPGGLRVPFQVAEADRARLGLLFRGLQEAPHDFTEEHEVRDEQGGTRWVHSRGYVVPREGEPVAIVGVSQDVTDWRRQQDELRDALQSQRMLLREVNHRVKNSLQIISAMLMVQSAGVKDPGARAMFDAAVMRVMAVGRVHERLYKSAETDTVGLAGYIERLALELAESGIFGQEADALTFDLDDGVVVAMDSAISVGLILNELLTNAAKHGRSPDGRWQTRIRLAGEGDSIVLAVQDGGPGMPPAPKTGKGIGRIIVETLVGQLGGVVETTAGPPSQVAIRFPARRVGPG